MTENELAKGMFELGLKVHRELGPGLLEGVYEECMFHEIMEAGFFAERQKPIPVVYKGIKMDTGFRADIVVEGKLILELKSVEALNEVHLAVMLTYLKFSGCKLGLIMNFHTTLFKSGVKRVISGYMDESFKGVVNDVEVSDGS
jgi:GxxExxY protein